MKSDEWKAKETAARQYWDQFMDEQSPLTDGWTEYVRAFHLGLTAARQPDASEVQARLDAAERMIDAVVSGDVRLGTKAKQFFGEYRHAYPKSD